jgi:hypothetical protein
MIRRAISPASSRVKCVCETHAMRLRRMSSGLSEASREDVELRMFFEWLTKVFSFAMIMSIYFAEQVNSQDQQPQAELFSNAH